MKFYQETIEVKANRNLGHGLVDITGRVEAALARSHIHTGLCTLFVQHTSASLCVQENADPAVLRDLERWMASTVSENFPWEHNSEGSDDMPAHIKSMLNHTSLQIPVVTGRLALGVWQGIYLWEHRVRPRTRSVVLHFMGI